MFWAWKAKVKTNVRSKAAIATRAYRGNSTSLTHRDPVVPQESGPKPPTYRQRNHDEGQERIQQDAKGTDNDEAPLTSRPTIHTNNTSMIKLFTYTWTNVWAGSPSVRQLQTNTIAVLGAGTRMIATAMY